jgi:protein-tyrosine phosphatase
MCYPKNCRSPVCEQASMLYLVAQARRLPGARGSLSATVPEKTPDSERACQSLGAHELCGEMALPPDGVWPMIDLHNHLLPGLDDGSRDMAEALTMCRVAVQDGIRTIVATPHLSDDPSVLDAEKIKATVGELNRRLASKGLPLEILPGMEVRIDQDIPELVADGKILPLNGGRYVLIEFHPGQIPVGFDNLVKELVISGHGAILGHPERNFAVQQNPEYIYRILSRLKEGELLIQVSADSLTGLAGPEALNTARVLLKNHLVHVIASDAHSPFLRSPRLSEAVIVAASLVGTEKARQMVWEVPLAVVHGQGHPQFCRPRTTTRWWDFFKRRLRRVKAFAKGRPS